MTSISPPLPFEPPRLYVLQQVWDDPSSARRAERLAAAWPRTEVRTFRYNDLPAIVEQEGWGASPKMGTLERVPPPIPILGLFRFDREAVDRDAQRMQEAYRGPGGFPFSLAAGGGAFTFFCSHTSRFSCTSLADLRPNPEHVCRPQWRLHQGRGCPHQCAYCSLGGFLISHVNTEAYLDRLADLLAQNPWQKTWLYDDVMDVLTLEPQLDTLAPMMRFFERTGDHYLIVHTKSDRVQGLLEANAPRNTIIVWSLTGPTQARHLERGAGTTAGRVEAARVCQEAGLTIRYKFKPIVPVPDWRAEATEAIDLALTRTRPDNLSMTVLMWMQVEDLEQCIPPKHLDPEFLAAARQAASAMRGHNTAPFPAALREKVYRHYRQEIRAREPETPVTLSTESLEMWKRLGPEMGFSPRDYVCGCGAGATPGKQRLQSNPWQDARAARTWDGQPAVPGAT